MAGGLVLLVGPNRQPSARAGTSPQANQHVSVIALHVPTSSTPLAGTRRSFSVPLFKATKVSPRFRSFGKDEWAVNRTSAEPRQRYPFRLLLSLSSDCDGSSTISAGPFNLSQCYRRERLVEIPIVEKTFDLLIAPNTRRRLPE